MQCVGWFDAEHIIERAVPTDVFDAIDPLTAAIGLPQRLAGLRAAASAQQRHGKTYAGRLRQRARSPHPPLEHSPRRHHC